MVTAGTPGSIPRPQFHLGWLRRRLAIHVEPHPPSRCPHADPSDALPFPPRRTCPRQRRPWCEGSPRNSGPTGFPRVTEGHPEGRSEQEGCQKWLLGSTAEEPSRVILLVDGYGHRGPGSTAATYINWGHCISTGSTALCDRLELPRPNGSRRHPELEQPPRPGGGTQCPAR